MQIKLGFVAGKEASQPSNFDAIYAELLRISGGVGTTLLSAAPVCSSLFERPYAKHTVSRLLALGRFVQEKRVQPS